MADDENTQTTDLKTGTDRTRTALKNTGRDEPAGKAARSADAAPRLTVLSGPGRPPIDLYGPCSLWRSAG